MIKTNLPQDYPMNNLEKVKEKVNPKLSISNRKGTEYSTRYQ